MGNKDKPCELLVFPDGETLAQALAGQIVEDLQGDLKDQVRVALGLSGGRTPRRLYEILGDRYADALPWSRVHIFWGDERYVPAHAPDNNARMAREAWLDKISIPPENLHPISTDCPDPEQAAWAYEQALRAFFGQRPRWNVLLLGMGSDGHTASLFPGSPALHERQRWVVAVRDATGRPRVTLTYPAINAAQRVYFMVTGVEKRSALAHLLKRDRDLDGCPACGVRPDNGACRIWADHAAAGERAREKDPGSR